MNIVCPDCKNPIGWPIKRAAHSKCSSDASPLFQEKKYRKRTPKGVVNPHINYYVFTSEKESLRKSFE